MLVYLVDPHGNRFPIMPGYFGNQGGGSEVLPTLPARLGSVSENEVPGRETTQHAKDRFLKWIPLTGKLICRFFKLYTFWMRFYTFIYVFDAFLCVCDIFYAVLMYWD